MSANDFISSSGAMKALWTRNLSLHLACAGGSTSRACRRTKGEHISYASSCMDIRLSDGDS
jgi:hypothetical protein